MPRIKAQYRYMTTDEEIPLITDTLLQFKVARNRFAAADIARKRIRTSRKEQQVVDVVRAYCSLMRESSTFGSIPGEHEPDCSSPQKVAEEIRYRLGLGWIGWLLLRTLILEIVKYLWSRTVSEEKD